MPDLLIPKEWAIKAKLARPFGDNDKEWEHWSENLLHPYSGNRSVLADCFKLLEWTGEERRCVLVLGYEHSPPRLSMEPAIRSLELIARQVCGIELSSRAEVVRSGLVHPVHQQLRLIAFEVLGRNKLS